ncbi:MAG: hypothetical protein AB7T49_18915 [Oligoflexales bacterium]
MLRTVLAIFTWSTMSFAYADFMPPNDLHLQDNFFGGTGITEQEFNEVIDQVSAVYAPIVKSHGGRLKFRRLWRSSTVNASAIQIFGTWLVNMYGGLARREEVTKDGFTLVACHELGHHLAGFPKTMAWAANEGQADYFSTLACSRTLWGNDTAGNAKARETVDPAAQAMCDAAYADVNGQNLCYRQAMAGFSLAKLLGNLGGQSNIAFDTPDQSVVERTNNAHPEAQCRLDTYTAGAICGAAWDINIIPQNEQESASYTCNTFQGFETGTRPLCWFKPGM